MRNVHHVHVRRGVWLPLLLAVVATLLVAAPAGAQSQPETFAYAPDRGAAGTVLGFQGTCPSRSDRWEARVWLRRDADGGEPRFVTSERVGTSPHGQYRGSLLVPGNAPADDYDVLVGCRWPDDDAVSPPRTVGRFVVEPGCTPLATSWYPWGGRIASGVASALTEGRGRDLVEIFAVTDSGELWTRWWGSDRGHSGWRSLGRPDGVTLTDTPAAVSWRGGVVNVYVRGSDGAVWQLHRERGAWRGWRSIGGIVDGGPSAVSVTDDRLDVFAIADGRLWWRSYADGAWGAWRDRGQPVIRFPERPLDLTLAPGAVTWNGGYVNVYARIEDGSLYQRFQRPDGLWSGWDPIAGVLDTGPAAVSSEPGQLDLFGVANGRLYRSSWTGSYEWVWENHRAPQLSPLADQASVIAWQSGRVDAFATAADGSVWQAHMPCVANDHHSP